MAKLTAEQKDDIINQYKSGNVEAAKQQVKDIASGKTTTTTPTTPTTSTSTSNSGNQWSSSNYKDSDGYYSGTERNAATAGAEFGGTGRTTMTKVETPKVETTTEAAGGDVGSRVRNAWDSLSYAEQQKRLSENPNLQANLTKYGATNKTAPQKTETTTGGTTEATETPTQGGWDYQDNSPERMKQIADNVNGFAQSDPRIFNNEDSFRKFFIDGKGRTPEQEAFLMDLYKNSKKYNELDGYTADNIGYMYAHGQVPDSYLNYLKNSNPERYAEVMDAKDAETNKIKDDASIGTINSMEGGEDTTTSNAIEWLKKQGLFVDKDGNLIDDRTENYASEEEQGYLKQIADLNAANLDIDNTVKHTYEDLVKAYPGATKATLMAMAQDMNSDLLREKENNLVELTRLQGYVGYMQAERQEMNKAGADSIAQLQKNLGMYYQYSPQGMVELAQAQYGATNITLDQADSGNETQKQMALQSVLDDYYAKYGSIIQRSEQQVINDVIAYAKKNGVGLAQALQENFVKPLQQKPQFATLSTGGSLTADKWAKLNDNTLYNVTTGETISTDGGNVSVTTSRGETITPISSASNSETTSNLMSKYPIGSSYKNGECGELMNLDASNSGSNIHFGSNLSEKTKWINRETYEGPQIGAYVVFDWSNKPGASEKMQKYGHVGKVVGMGDGYIDIRNQNGSKSGQITVDRYPLKDYEKYIAGYVDPTKTESYGYWGSPMDSGFAELKGKGTDKLNAKQKEALDFATEAYQMMYDLAVNGDLDYFLRMPDGQKVLGNYESAQFSNDASYTRQAILDALRKDVTDQRVLRIVNDLMGIIEKKLRWKSGAAISGSEWNSNSIMLIPQAKESYDTQFRKFQTFEGQYLKAPIDSANWYLKTNIKYIPLFDGKSPYYTKYVVSAEQEADDAI